MKAFLTTLTVGVAALSLVACNNKTDGNAASPADTQSAEAQKAAGDQTIAAGLTTNAKFMGAAKAAGLDQTLAGPGPYTVIVADDAAFDALPAGTYDGWMKPENRGKLTGVMTGMILSGTVLAEDLANAIDTGKGKAVVATIGGGTLTATKEGGKIVLTDAGGHKATVTQADQKFSNGVVHHVDGLLLPSAA
ncbi:MAG: fasciclin domain-containing protein [Sphingomicrobium sp.]